MGCIWNKLDHIVPHPSNEYEEQFAIEGDNQNKLQREVIGIMSIANKTTLYGIWGKEDNDLPFMSKKNRMLEKDWSDTPDGVFPASCDSDTTKEVTSAASDDTRMSIHGTKSGHGDKVGEFCEEDPILDDKSAAALNNLYCYPLNQISQSKNDLSFLDDDRDDKESSDILYYGWPDIGNFEDVDRIFRSCDSTFGLGSLSNEDDLCWFLPTNADEESVNALKSASKLNSLSEHQEISRENSGGPSADDCNKNNLLASDEINLKCIDTEDSALNHLSFGNGSDTQSESKGNSMFNEQINLPKKQLKQLTKSEGKRKDRYMENGSSFNHNDNHNQFTDVKHLFGDTSQVFSPLGLQQHKQVIGSDSFSYMQTHVPYLHLDYSHPSDQISVCPIASGIKSKNNGHASPSPKESSYASNQVQSVDSCLGPLLGAPSVTTNEKREKQHHCQDLQVPSARSFNNSLSVQKQVHLVELEIEEHSEVGVSIAVPAELDSSNGQESSCMSPLLDEISLEATSFRQLQQVMEKLDTRTKLCIRDSLYRLAKSAEQRHNCANSSGSFRVDRDGTGALMAEDRNECTGFIDMETNTNPIDRSIAHLLFHRPSGPSVMHANNAFSFKSHAMMQGSITSPPVKVEKQVCQTNTSSDAEEILMTSDKK